MLTRFIWLFAIVAFFPAVVLAESVPFTMDAASSTAPVTQAIGPLDTMLLKVKSRFDNSLFFPARQVIATTNGTRTKRHSLMGGLLEFTKFSGAGLGNQFLNGSVMGFTLDFNKPIRWAKSTYTLTSLADAPTKFQAKEGELRELWGRHYNEIFVGTKQEQKQKANAFSLAMFEILNETGSNLDVRSGPGFSVQPKPKQQIGGILDLANQWLASLDGAGPQGDVWVASVKTRGANNWRPVLVGLPPTNPVPEPGVALAFAGLGLGFAMVRLGRRQRSRGR